jgi:hypothetical protein
MFIWDKDVKRLLASKDVEICGLNANIKELQKKIKELSPKPVDNKVYIITLRVDGGKTVDVVGSSLEYNYGFTHVYNSDGNVVFACNSGDVVCFHVVNRP